MYKVIIILSLALFVSCGTTANNNYSTDNPLAPRQMSKQANMELDQSESFSARSSRRNDFAQNSESLKDNYIDEKNTDESDTIKKRLITYNGNVSMLVNIKPEDFQLQIDTLSSKFNGYITAKSFHHISIEIPANNFNEFLKSLNNYGEIKNKNIYSNDVTKEFFDLQLRLENLEKSRKRFMELLSQAENVATTLEVEREINRVTMEIEQIKGSLRYYSQELDYSTCTINFSQKEDEAKPGPLGWVFYGLWKGVRWLFIWD